MTRGTRNILKAEMLEGFAQGRTLIQEEWAHPEEIREADECIAEGKCTTQGWNYEDNFQCEVRRLVGVIGG